VPNPRDRPLAWSSEPEVSVVEEEIDPVLLGLERIVDRAGAENGQGADAKLVAARRASIDLYFPFHFDARFLGQPGECVPAFGRYGAFDDHRLEEAGAVPHYHESNLTGRAQVGDPAADANSLACMKRKL
jgi:hypothetical protein